MLHPSMTYPGDKTLKRTKKCRWVKPTILKYQYPNIKYQMEDGCRTGFSAGRGLQPRPQCFVSLRQHKFRTLVPDGVCNPVRNVLSGSISFGRT